MKHSKGYGNGNIDTVILKVQDTNKEGSYNRICLKMKMFS